MQSMTQSKIFNAQVACPVEGGCDSVLNSDYAQLFGIPLSAFGACKTTLGFLQALLEFSVCLSLAIATLRLVSRWDFVTVKTLASDTDK